jgi:hypothetical protein
MITRAMRSIALILSAACISCSSREGTLPPPGPPEPAPPPRTAAPSPPQAVRVPHPLLSGKRIAVIIFRVAGSHREVDGENSMRLVNTMAQSGIASKMATSVPAELPPKILEAARASAEAFVKSGGAADVYLYGEISPAAEVQVRLVAVGLGGLRIIDNFGNKGPLALQNDVLRKTLEETLTSLDGYFRK